MCGRLYEERFSATQCCDCGETRRWILGAMAILCLVAWNVSIAENYYVGAEVGGEYVAFDPEVGFVSGRANVSFDDRAYGSSIGVVAGHRWKVRSDLSLAMQGRFSASDTVWKSELPEPASFEYAVPVNAAVSFLPTFHAWEKLALFAELGLAWGKIQERKSAVVTSRYDVEQWQQGGIAGAGISAALGDQWFIRIGYRRTWYKELKYDTHLADGTHVETNSSKPVQSIGSLGVIREF